VDPITGYVNPAVERKDSQINQTQFVAESRIFASDGTTRLKYHRKTTIKK
jgi:hypothetical protein